MKHRQHPELHASFTRLIVVVVTAYLEYTFIYMIHQGAVNRAEIALKCVPKLWLHHFQLCFESVTTDMRQMQHVTCLNMHLTTLFNDSDAVYFISLVKIFVQCPRSLLPLWLN